ncbi:MAG: hypothetical protein WCI04_05835 [archaeon]
MDSFVLILAFVLIFLAGLASKIIFDKVIERKVKSLYMSELGKKGKAKFRENEERKNEALMEGINLIKEGKSIPDTIKEVLAKYPDVTKRYASKLEKMIGKEEEIEEEKEGEDENE